MQFGLVYFLAYSIFRPFTRAAILSALHLTGEKNSPDNPRPGGAKRAIIGAGNPKSETGKVKCHMKIFFYTLRPYDELPCAQKLSAETGIAFDGCEEYPNLENAALAAGCDAVSMTPCDMSAPMVERFHELGVKYICCRSIGYDHVDREKAHELGMKVSNVDYPPRGGGEFRHHADDDVPAPGGPYPQAGARCRIIP